MYLDAAHHRCAVKNHSRRRVPRRGRAWLGGASSGATVEAALGTLSMLGWKRISGLGGFCGVMDSVTRTMNGAT